MEKIKEVKEAYCDLAAKPSSLIYVGIIALLLISEYKNPTDLWGVIYKIIVLIFSFIVVTVFNSQYFKRYWKNYNRQITD